MRRISCNYIISKNRAYKQITHREMERAGIPHSFVVEKAQYKAYRDAFPDTEILVIDGDDLGVAAARNACLDFARQQGYRVCWTWDDDVRIMRRTGTRKYYYLYGQCMDDRTEVWGRAMTSLGYEGLVLEFATMAFGVQFPAVPACTELRMAYAIDVQRCKLRYDESFVVNEDSEFSIRFHLSGFRMLSVAEFVINASYNEAPSEHDTFRRDGLDAIAHQRYIDTYGADHFRRKTKGARDGDLRPLYSKFAREGQCGQIARAMRKAEDEIHN